MKLKQKIDNLLDKDFKLVEKRKIIFAIPIVILVIAAVLMIIFRFTLGSALNLGTDFTGGYSVDIKLGNQLTDDNYQEYYDKITETLKSVKTENGKEYKITISGAMQRQGSGDNASIHVKYAAVNGVSESEMSKQINPAIISALEKSVLNKVPSVTIKDNVITATYDEPIDDTNEGSPFETLKKAFLAIVSDIGLTESGVDVKLNTENRKQIVITTSNSVANSSEVKDKIISAMTLPDVYAGSVTGGDLVGATVSTELLFNAILAVSLALIFMLCYIGLRFQLSSGIACIIALLHDVLIMFAVMAIFNIEINSTFIAALITILGYSINNSIILFDRVRENMRTVYAKSMSPEDIANKSIKETLIRSINTTITTLIMIAMIAIIGVNEIKIFAFPIIFGLLAGTFSSIFIAPSLWALFQRVGKNKQNFRIEPKNKNKKTEKKSKPTEIGA